MRILVLHTRYRLLGGEDAAVDLQVDLLRARGHEVRLHTAENPPGISAVPKALAAVWNPRAAADVAHAIRTWQPDVVHVHNTWFAMTPAVVARSSALGRPLVATLHNFRLVCANSLLLRDGSPCTNCVGSSALSAIRYRCYRGLTGSVLAAANIEFHARAGTWTRLVDQFIVMSQFARNVFVQHGLPPERIAVVPQVAPDPGPRSAPPSESDHVLFVGRLSHEKGVDTLLSAWDKLSPDGLQLRIIGDGPLRESFADTTSSSVRMLGSMSPQAVRLEMLNARALVVPSKCFEAALPLVAIEAMAAGLPVLGSDHGGIGEAVRAIDNSMAVDPRKGGAWADALAMTSNGALMDRTGARSRVLYDERHRVERLGDLLDEILHRIAA